METRTHISFKLVNGEKRGAGNQQIIHIDKDIEENIISSISEERIVSVGLNKTTLMKSSS